MHFVGLFLSPSIVSVYAVQNYSTRVVVNPVLCSAREHTSPIRVLRYHTVAQMYKWSHVLPVMRCFNNLQVKKMTVLIGEEGPDDTRYPVSQHRSEMSCIVCICSQTQFINIMGAKCRNDVCLPVPVFSYVKIR